MMISNYSCTVLMIIVLIGIPNINYETYSTHCHCMGANHVFVLAGWAGSCTAHCKYNYLSQLISLVDAFFHLHFTVHVICYCCVFVSDSLVFVIFCC
jgi:hypothetical protein